MLIIVLIVFRGCNVTIILHRAPKPGLLDCSFGTFMAINQEASDQSQEPHPLLVQVLEVGDKGCCNALLVLFRHPEGSKEHGLTSWMARLIQMLVRSSQK